MTPKTAIRMAAVLVAAAGVAGPLAAPASAAAGKHVYTWGADDRGQLGNGGAGASTDPVRLSLAATEIAVGREHALALSGGAVYAWGWNGNGQLGDGTTDDSPTPQKVTGVCPGSRVVQVETGHYSSFARCADGTAYGWGRDDSGQLGDGSKAVARTRPVRVGALTHLIDIAGGRDFALAVDSDHHVWAWGSGSDGELGQGNTAGSTTPIRVPDLPAIVGVSAGRDHALARTAGGALWAWGANEYGEVGDGTTTDRDTPTTVLTGVKDMAAGAYHSLAVLKSGAVKAWGRNTNGQLGDGTKTLRSSPVSVHGLSGVTSVACGRDHSLATAGGKVYAWGKNDFGQLGDGGTTNQGTPELISGLSGAVDVGGGRDFSAALAG